jgi:hypothetical protein
MSVVVQKVGTGADESATALVQASQRLSSTVRRGRPRMRWLMTCL